MSYHHTYDRPMDTRGKDIRRWLLGVIRDCDERGVLLPQYAVLGRALGIDRSQVSRHLKRLRDEAAYVELPAKQWRRHVSLYRNRDLRRTA